MRLITLRLWLCLRPELAVASPATFAARVARGLP